MSSRNTSSKGQVPKTDYGILFQVRGISGSFNPMNSDKSGKSSNDSKLKQAEESLRTVISERLKLSTDETSFVDLRLSMGFSTIGGRTLDEGTKRLQVVKLGLRSTTRDGS
ncbi:hypothetical protein F3Y22_tig00008222pilonHSYRG00002 [Hibiscus syriacus]|uniref:Uncharacterized protein n=1 Tax=Hibiscus syriacus TaxID=106335 RepID=A0A6A3CEX7_HIBSY|nr:hypothetical protein F3Y22_tig00008222pilonHSYRG00002 [Hibiscus syriacus]